MLAVTVARSQPAPLHRAHAHNDYLHDRPLLDALERGFTSIEFDVHERDGLLLVGHDPEDLTADRTIEALYLAPLAAWIAAHDGRVYADTTMLQLLVDFKTEPLATYAALERALMPYDSLLVRYEAGAILYGRVRVVISGHRPRETLAAQGRRVAFFDGRPADLYEPSIDATLMPLVSESWRAVAGGSRGQPNRAARRRIRDLVDAAHARGIKVRFWATPEDPALWAYLHHAGVDYLNTDRLVDLQAFLQGR
jgi:glycerophosphoryl diester phosphodiesterase